MKAFALVELLVVVTLVAILAVIAVPRFHRANEQSKIAETREDLYRSAICLESYAVDQGGRYPPRGMYHRVSTTETVSISVNAMVLDPIWLTTPVAYMTDEEILLDPFQAGDYDPARAKTRENAGTWFWGRYRYAAASQYPTVSSASQALLRERYGEWRLVGAGPDGYVFNDTAARPSNASSLIIPYDPTNGLLSIGDIGRSQIEEEITLESTLRTPSRETSATAEQAPAAALGLRLHTR